MQNWLGNEKIAESLLWQMTYPKLVTNFWDLATGYVAKSDFSESR